MAASPGSPAGATPRGTKPVPGAPLSPSPAPPYAPPPNHPIHALGAALLSGEAPRVRAAAAALRRRLRLDPAAFEEAATLLLDPATDPDLRRALALVLGTFGGARNDEALLELLRRFPGDAATVRCALFALGGTREPEEDDEVFGLGDRPFGAEGPGGLGITVRRALGDPALRAAMAPFLGAGEVEVRGAAAAALRHSVGEGDVREAFLGALGAETADEVLEVVGEALGGRAGATAEAGERSAIVAGILARAGAEEYGGLRFRVEDDFERIALTAGEREALSALAAPGHPFSVRSFAMTVAARSAGRGGPGAEEEARVLLGGILGWDGDGAARDLAARLLRRLPASSAATAVLCRAATGDAAWNVRFTSLETLASWGPLAGVREALAAGTADPDERVAKRAAELLEGLPER